MRAVLLVAWREFRQVVRTRGFWISLLALPAAFVVVFAAQRLGGGEEAGSAYLLIDASGRYGEAVRRRLELDHQRFAEASPPPAAASAREAQTVADATRALLGQPVATSQGPRRLATVIFIPPDFGGGAGPVRVWSSGAADPQLVDAVRGELSRRLRAEALTRAGLPPEKVEAFDRVQAPLSVTAFAREGRMVAATLLPLGAAYLLLMSMLMSGSLLLQGVMEERSNKLIEALLACVTPAQLMYGKLLGLIAVGLIMLLVWAGCALAGASLLGDGPAGAVRESLFAAESPWLAAAVVFYFLAGQLMYSTLFLAVGAMSDSMQDAQSYLTPIMLLILLPFMLLIGRMVQEPDGLLPTVMPWIPIYTPFAMLARLGQGVTPVEAVGTTIILAAFVVLELWLLGRLFRQVLLRSGQPPRLAELARLMGRRDAD